MCIVRLIDSECLLRRVGEYSKSVFFLFTGFRVGARCCIALLTSHFEPSAAGLVPEDKRFIERPQISLPDSNADQHLLKLPVIERFAWSHEITLALNAGAYPNRSRGD